MIINILCTDIKNFYFIFNGSFLGFCCCKFCGRRGVRNFDFGILRDSVALDTFLIRINTGVAVRDLSYSIATHVIVCSSLSRRANSRTKYLLPFMNDEIFLISMFTRIRH